MARGSGVFYGWVIVCVSFITLILVCGSWGSFSIYINPIQTEFAENRASVSLAMSIGLLVYGASLPLIGRLVDTWGPKKVILISSIIMGIGIILLSMISNLRQFHLLYGVVLAIGYAGAGLVSNTSLVRSWFPKRSEFVLSLMQSGLPLGQLVVIPVAAYLTLEYGWRKSFLIMGLTLLIIIPVMIFFLTKDLTLDQSIQTKQGRDTVDLSFQGKFELKLFKKLRAPFLILLVVYFICGFTDIPIVTHMAPFILDGGFDEMIAANILSLIGGTTLVGTLFFGFLSRKFERKLLLVTIYLTRALTFFILFDKPYLPFLIIFAIFFGLTQFSMVPLISAWIGDTYGQVYLGRLFGIITLLHALGASLGTFLNGYIFDVTDSYLSAFVISSALSFIASILIYFSHEQT